MGNTLVEVILALGVTVLPPGSGQLGERLGPWQATYPSPAAGLAAAPIRSERSRFRLEPISADPPPGGSDPAS
jgi:hypothetical protein